MSRLTLRNFKYCDSDFMDSGLGEPMNKLAHYEDLEEQGRLIELPCKVGDTVWEVVPELNSIENYRITDITITDCGIGYETPYLGCGFETEDFGKTAFLTKEEAEAKLEELKGTEDE